MALRSRFGYQTPIPGTTTRKSATKAFSFVKGVDTYSDNDDVDVKALVYATDARMVQKGRYATRKGASRYSVPVGEAVSASVASTTGASTQIVNGVRWLAEKLTVTSDGGVTMAEIRVRTTPASVGTLLVELRADNAGTPGDVIATSSILPANVSGTFAYIPVYFMAAPAVVNTNVRWLVIRGQNADVGNYEISTTTSSTNAKVYNNGSWATAAYSLNARLSVAPANAVKGVYRAYRYNGLKVTLFVAGTTLYSVNDTTGATTAVFTGLSGSALRYRFDMAQDSVYFTDDGISKPWKLVLSTMTVTSVTTAPAVALSCIEHKGLMWYINGDDRSQLYFSNFGVYDTFTSTDFLTMGAPKGPHTIVALAKLNGALYPFAKKNKYVVLGDSNATWSIDEATDQRGTFSQESVVFDENYIYHADDDGIHIFNGTDSVNLAKPFLEDYRAIPDKTSIALEVKNNRLYCFYTPAGGTVNSECFVSNLSIWIEYDGERLPLHESRDLNTYIGRTFARFTQDNIYVQASNRVAALYYGEPDSNSYDNLGAPLAFELRTAYSHFDTPGQLKRIPVWRPVFDSASGVYTVEVGYAYDHQTDVHWSEVSLATNSPRFNTGLTFNSGQTLATTGGVIEPQGLYMTGEFRRVQRRFRHIGAHEPVEVDSETLTLEEQRLT